MDSITEKTILSVPIFLVDRFPTGLERNVYEYGAEFFKKCARRIQLDSLQPVRENQGYGVHSELSGFNAARFHKTRGVSFSAKTNEITIEAIRKIISEFVSEGYTPTDFASQVLISPYTEVILTPEEKEAQETLNRIGRNLGEYLFIQQRRFGAI